MELYNHKLISRKDFSTSLCKSLLSFSLFSFLSKHQLLYAVENSYSTKQLMDEVHHLSYLLAKNKINQITWQDSLEKIFQKIDLKDYIADINLDKILKKVFPENQSKNQNFHRIHLGKTNKLLKRKILKGQLFIMKKNRSVVPHGHNYMTSGFLVLKGEFHGKHYDRIQDKKKHILIKPTIDRNFSQGEFSTISDERDNVHWFKSVSDYGVLLNIHIKNLKLGPKLPGRVYLNPIGEKVSQEYILAKKISRQESYRLFS